MPKWLIWTLLELTTFLMMANLIFLWLSHNLKKKNERKQSDSRAYADKKAESNTDLSSQIDHSENTNTFKRLAHFLDQQINFAASAINPQQENQHETNTLKLWGTVLRAERAIILNQASEQPKPILNRFLANLLYALSASKLQTADPEELNQNLKDMEAEFFQASELLITKESLSKNQALLNEDLRNNIDRAEKRIRQLGVKKTEQQRLQLEINKLQKKIKTLELNQKEYSGNHSEVQAHTHETHKNKIQGKHTSFKQISTLNSLSNRQQMVIEQLKSEIDKARRNQSPHDLVESQKVAIAKMERISEESQTLILQLEAELESSNLSITSLRQDINAKDEKLAELEKLLSSSNETAIGNLQTLNANKKETLGSLRDDLNVAMENMSTENLIEQDKDTKMLERLLQESETCVTLLAQELETAEETNNQLKEKVEALAVAEGKEPPTAYKPLLDQREKNRELVQQVTTLKEQLLSTKNSKDFQELRVEYNKKSLECDRLQLAFSDLEIKYLGTLN